MSLLNLAIIVLVLALILSLPIYPYSRTYGPYPSSLFGILLILLVLYLAFGGGLRIR